MKRKLLVGLVPSHFIVQANIALPAVIGNNMVLQQPSRVRLWGWNNPTERIRVTTSWGQATDSTIVASDGKWQLWVSAPKTGGPYSIIFLGDNTLTLTHVLVREVGCVPDSQT